ncbi:MAG: T9SS type A sorting domain-containing protein [Bacteroidetes bacterium]|nr:T9SS type A sorting domain-containing protein [Bacteroidota bacterium]
MNCAIYSLDGRLVHSQRLTISPGKQKNQLGNGDLELVAGSYVVIISNSSSSSSIKLIVQD